MVSDAGTTWAAAGQNVVLILVLMEYGLWHEGGYEEQTKDQVLILVLMEYGLWLLKGFISWILWRS